MYRDEFKNLPLSDRFMFGEVMRNSGICKLFLEELLQCKIERIVFAAKEADLSDTVLGHGIRLDVFLADENNTHYDVEMQKVRSAVELGAEAIMDLSSHGNPQPILSVGHRPGAAEAQHGLR